MQLRTKKSEIFLENSYSWNKHLRKSVSAREKDVLTFHANTIIIIYFYSG